MSGLRGATVAALVAGVLAAPAPASAATGGRPGVTERVSVGAGGAEGSGETADPFNHVVSISADGRFVAFSSAAVGLVPNDNNHARDVFVRDRIQGVTERVSVTTDGSEAKGTSSATGMGSTAPSISADGRFVAFMSEATNLVAKDNNGAPDVFVHDRETGVTEVVSVAPNGSMGNFWSRLPSISADGRFVAFDSSASDLVNDDGNGSTYDIFVRDRQSAVTALVSRAPGGAPSDGVSYGASISGDGSTVAFYSSASNLVSADANGYSDVFVSGMGTGLVERVSVASDGAEGNDISYSPSISADGRMVAFVSKSSNLVPTDLNGTLDAFLHDRETGRTRRISVTSAGAGHDDAPPRQGSPYEDVTLSAVRPRVSLSPDGRFAAFVSRASNLAPGDANGLGDVFVRDLATGATERVSLAEDDGDADGSTLWAPAVSEGGRVVAFASDASELVTGDDNATRDVFARDRGAPIGVTGLRAERQGETVSVTGSMTMSGSWTAAEDAVGDVDLVDGGPAGMDLERAALVWRPQTSDLLVRWEPTEMPSARGVATGGSAFEVRSGVIPSVGGVPGVAYSASFNAGGHRLFVEVVGGPIAEARLFQCDAYPCTDLGMVQGSLGSAGVEANAVIPISSLPGVSVGSRITEISVETGVGDVRGLVFVPENVVLDELNLSRPVVEIGLGSAGEGPDGVSFEPATVDGSSFSAQLAAPEGPAVAWVRTCLGATCSLSSSPA